MINKFNWIQFSKYSEEWTGAYSLANRSKFSKTSNPASAQNNNQFKLINIIG